MSHLRKPVDSPTRHAVITVDGVFGKGTDNRGSPGRRDDYGRLSFQSNATRANDDGGGDYEGGDNSCRDKTRRLLDTILEEWRVMAVIILLVIICVMIGDVDFTVRWKALEDYKQPMTYSVLQKSMRTHPSFFTYYTSKRSSKTLLMEMPLAFLGNSSSRAVVFSATHARGSWNDENNIFLLHEPAENTDHTVFRFNLTSDMSGVNVIRLQHGIRTTSDADRLAVELGAWSGWVATLPIVTMSDKTAPEPSVIVDASDMLDKGFYISDVADAQVSRLSLQYCRSYPQNLDLTVEYLRPLPQEGPRDPRVKETTVEMITFSLALLPEKPLIARAEDGRIGYFSLAYNDLGDHRNTTTYLDLSMHEEDQVDTRLRVINRRRLQSGKNYKPITYYIDPTVPEKWRPAFKAGVEAWNPAFIAAGFPDRSIRGVLPGDKDWPHDYTAGDVRYSSLSWTVNLEKTFALGPSLVDPRSGEILNSDIIFTNGWVKHWITTIETQDATKDPLGVLQGMLAELVEYAKDEDGGNHHHHDHDHAHAHSHGPSGMRKSLRHHPQGMCQEARTKFDMSPRLLQMVMEANASPDLMKVVPDDIINAGIRDVVMHEVGHTLGLRHNFKASSAVTWEQTQTKAYTQEHGLAVSVMDYLPLNIVSGRDPDADVDYFSPVIGEYDYMAIKYGYMEVPEEKDGVPHPTLKVLADHNLPFSTDEDDASPLGPDPFHSTFDMTADPMKYYADRFDLVAELRPKLLDRTVAIGEEFTRYAAVESMLLKTALSAAVSLTKYIGGFDIRRFRRDAEVVAEGPIKVVSAADQEAALAQVMRVLADEGPDANGNSIFPQPEVFPYLLGKGGQCDTLYTYCYKRSPVEVLKMIDIGRTAILGALLDRSRLDRVRTGEWYQKSAGEVAFGVTDLLQGITNALWGPTLALSARVAETRNWNMQIVYVEKLIELANEPVSSVAREITAVANGELARLQDSIEEVLAGPNAAANPAYSLFKTVMVKLTGADYVIKQNNAAAAPAVKKIGRRA